MSFPRMIMIMKATKMSSLNTQITAAIFLGFQILSCLTSVIKAQPSFLSWVCQTKFGNYTTNSPFKTNLDSLISSLTSHSQIDYGFYNLSIGHDSETVNGIALCRPDLSTGDCQKCLQDGLTKIIRQCPNQKDAIGWYEECMIRYSNRYILGKMEFHPWYHSKRRVFGIEKGTFNRTASTLLAELQKEASASKDSHYKFAAGKAVVLNSSSAIYALVQCTPDLQSHECYYCLDYAINFSLTEFHGQAARVYLASCSIRYESFVFFNQTHLNELKVPRLPTLPSASLPTFLNTNTEVNPRHRRKSLVNLAIPTGATILLVLGLCVCRRKKIFTKIGPTELELDIREMGPQEFSLKTIKAATCNFSADNRLGEGGFGEVYKGKLASGEEIAVKRLARDSKQGIREFRREVCLLANLQHKNLVRILGFCSAQQEKMLVYEFLPNLSLDQFLFDSTKRILLDWKTRFNIILGIAKGLLYIHEDSRLKVGHRDLKLSNILLDEYMEPKISDFGLAKLFNQAHEGAMTTVMGTWGYIAPEYLHSAHYTIKCDVYSFGVLVLEIVSGLSMLLYQGPTKAEQATAALQPNETVLSQLARRLWNEKKPLDFVDSTLDNKYDTGEARKCIRMALQCISPNPAERPSMREVVLALGIKVSKIAPASVHLPTPKLDLLDDETENLNASNDHNSAQTNSVVVIMAGDMWPNWRAHAKSTF